MGFAQFTTVNTEANFFVKQVYGYYSEQSLDEN